jgi:hypothetical protein
MSVSSIIGIVWAANWALPIEYHGIVGLRLSSLDFSAPVFLWDIPFTTRGSQRSWGLGPQWSYRLGPQLNWGLLQRQKLGTTLWQMVCFSRIFRSMLPSATELRTRPTAELGTWPVAEQGTMADSWSVSRLSWGYFFLDPSTTWLSHLLSGSGTKWAHFTWR